MSDRGTSRDARDMPVLCRDCFAVGDNPARCENCGSPRVIGHGELLDLAIAHIDCDAFYASVEKRDNPELRDHPVIIGGGRRGVVSTACYVARIHGVHSAMPMFKALKACPNAVVIKPDMRKYSAVSKEVRSLMLSLTPLVEPLSIDEAFLDLTGTARLHRASPAESLARLATRVEDDIGITVSIGLSHNKFLAKVASDLDKPRGFSVIGRAETIAFLARQPVSLIPGVGKTTVRKLAGDGFRTIADLQAADDADLARRYGTNGLRLARLSRGEDVRTVDPSSQRKSISSETTFDEDIADHDRLRRKLWRLSEKVSDRMKAAGISGKLIVLKLKTADFQILTRNTTLDAPTQLADTIFEAAEALLRRETSGPHTGRAYRLIGVGVGSLGEAGADTGDFFAGDAQRREEMERAIDAVRARFGSDSVQRGRGFEPKPRSEPSKRG